MLQPYRRILALPGAVAFSAAGLVARMPYSMAGLGIVLLISSRTGSYAEAGVVAAVEVLAGALGSPVLARLMDRHGQTTVIPVAAAGSAVGFAVLIWSVEAGWPVGWTWGAAAIGGICFPPYGSSVRARWAHAVTDRGMLTTAFALEGVADEVVFILGPVLVTLLATAVHPAAGLVAAVVASMVGGLLLAAQRSTAPPHTPAAGRTGAGQPLVWSQLGPLCGVAVGLGCLFGAVEVATVAFAEESGDRGYAGWLLAGWAFGSMVAGLVLGSLPGPGNPLRRLRFGAALLTATVAVAALAQGPLLLGLLLVLSGLAIAPTVIAATSLAEAASPPTRVTEGITWMTTGLTIGVAPGAALAGIAVDAWGASAAFVVPVAGGVLAAATGWLIRDRTARRAGSASAPGKTVDMSSTPPGVDSGRRPHA